MSHKRRILAVLGAAALAAASAGLPAKTISLPAEGGAPLTPSALPGYAKATTDCVQCHSAEYMHMQPATAPRVYWESMVKRMRDVFKAPVPEADIPALVDYLSKTYGAEKPKN